MAYDQVPHVHLVILGLIPHFTATANSPPGLQPHDSVNAKPVNPTAEAKKKRAAEWKGLCVCHVRQVRPANNREVN